MPTFTYADDQGRTVTLTRDTEPTEAELDQAFAAQRAPSPAAAQVPSSALQFAGRLPTAPAARPPVQELEVMDMGMPVMARPDPGPRPTTKDAIRKAIELSAGGAFGAPTAAQINQLYLAMQDDYDRATKPVDKSERDKAHELLTRTFIFENNRLPNPAENANLYKKAATVGTRQYSEGFMVRDKNSNFAGFTFVDNSTGEVKVRKPNGELVPMTEDFIPATATSFGKEILPINDFMKLRGQVTDDEISLNRFSNYAKRVGQLPVGISRLADEFSARFKTLMGDPMTKQQITAALAKGELQGLIGATRLSTVGGGVMTEQDAIRVVQRLGGDVDSFQNPEVVRRAIASVYAERYRRSQDNLNFYNLAVDNYYGRPNSQGAAFYKPLKPIDVPPEMAQDGLEMFGPPPSLAEMQKRAAELKAKAGQPKED